MPYRPTHQAQLGRGTPVPGRTRGSLDCGPRSWAVLADGRSGGRRRPGIAFLRRRGGVPGAQPTNIDDARKALHGLTIPGRTPLRYYRKRRVAHVRQAVRKHFPVHLAIDYGAWNRSQGKRTGDPAFRGGHSVAILGQRKRRLGVEWLLYDSLDDGRRPGIARGARWVLRRHLLAAAVALAGGNADGIWAGVIGGGRVR